MFKINFSSFLFRLLLPYERCQKGEESKGLSPCYPGRPRLNKTSSNSEAEDTVEVKREAESPQPTETPPPSDVNSTRTLASPPVQSILSPSVVRFFSF